MKTLITGANGFLGRRVVRDLLARGESDLRLVVRSLDASAMETVAREFPDAGIEWCVGDLTDPAFTEKVARDAGLVYHLASGMRGNGPDMIFNTVVGTDNLCAALQRQTTLRRIVLVSSFAVYGLARVRWNHLLTENSPLEEHPEWREPYTYSKLKQEQLLQKYRLPGVIIRPGVIYGEGGPQLSARVGIAVGPVFLSLGGFAWVPLTYVENCAEAVVLAGRKDGIEGQVFNIVDDEILRARQYRRRYSREVRKLHSIILPYPLLLLFSWCVQKYHQWSKGQLPAVLTPYKVRAAWKHCRFDNSKAKRLLGWQPRVRLKEALSRTFTHAKTQL